MNTIYFYNGNREIVTENVIKCYSMIEQFGFQPAIGKIKMITGDDLNGVKLVKVSIVKKNNTKELSINNFMLEYEPVTDDEERRNAKTPVNGQHRMIALYLLEQAGKLTFDENEMVEVVKIPANMDICTFTAAMNTDKPWNYGDFKNVETGNSEIDYIESKMKEHGLKSDVAYSIYTLGQPDIKPSMIRDLRLGINKLPKKLELNKATRNMGDRILQALENSAIGETDYNNGRFAKGLKKFYKEVNPDMDKLIEMIGKIGKNVWHGHKPEGSPEAAHHAANFKEWYKTIG